MSTNPDDSLFRRYKVKCRNRSTPSGAPEKVLFVLFGFFDGKWWCGGGGSMTGVNELQDRGE